jgi:hypothetical protein
MWEGYRAKALNLGTDLERVCSEPRENKSQRANISKHTDTIIPFSLLYFLTYLLL